MGRCRLCLVGCGAIAQRHAAAIRLLNVRMLDSGGSGEQPYVEVVAAADTAVAKVAVSPVVAEATTPALIPKALLDSAQPTAW